ncbi:MAG: hypothetical protein F4Y80_06605 [Caldilineaceae bacterium SB0665_bin_21]|nr:hypothetical protein [Caldilineaceae bacterium SB0665_bin_21]MYA04419.1 hypothetical protein [Caldilineaceae bacterium SB0664_bin_22]
MRTVSGYPDHMSKMLFALLEAWERVGMSLSETCGMWPVAFVCGFRLAHP